MKDQSKSSPPPIGEGTISAHRILASVPLQVIEPKRAGINMVTLAALALARMEAERERCAEGVRGSCKAAKM